MKARALLAVFFGATLASPLAAQVQQSNDRGLEANRVKQIVPPASRVADFADVFARSPGDLQELSQGLRELSERHQYSVYFVVYAGIIGSDVNRRAEEFRDYWLQPGVEGLVAVCDTDSKTIAYAFSRISEKGRSKFQLSDYQTLDAVAKGLRQGGEAKSEADYLKNVGNRLVAELSQKLSEREQPRPGLPWAYLAVFALVTLLVFALIWATRRKAAKEQRHIAQVQFPEIEISPRLGANFGGGLSCEVTFTPLRREEEPSEGNTQASVSTRPERPAPNP